jgi:hypothetical protein
LPGKDLVHALNQVAARYQRVLFINDSCHAAALEKSAPLAENIIRLYSAADNEEAIDLDFSNGPYGLSNFVQDPRNVLKSKPTLKIKGMSFLATMAFRTFLQLENDSAPSIDLQQLFKGMNAFRDRYDDDVRQAKVQHFKMIPAKANFEILKRSPP